MFPYFDKYLDTDYLPELVNGVISYVKHHISDAIKTEDIADFLTYLGFSSQSHFCRVFKAETGVSPNDYKYISSKK